LATTLNFVIPSAAEGPAVSLGTARTVNAHGTELQPSALEAALKHVLLSEAALGEEWIEGRGKLQVPRLRSG
jgi:hypothetical protein